MQQQGTQKRKQTQQHSGTKRVKVYMLRFCDIYVSARRLHKTSINSFQLDEVTGVVQEMHSDDNNADETVPSSRTVDRPIAAEKTEDDELATLKEQLEVEVA